MAILILVLLLILIRPLPLNEADQGCDEDKAQDQY